MTTFTTAPGRPVAYGYTIGMLCAEWNIPFVPGDLNNATTFDFPVRYLTVDGAVGADVLSGDALQYAEDFVSAARRLEAEGVRAITGNCGYMGAYQQVVAEAVSIPVFLSSLLQAPFLLSMLGGTADLGVLVANADGISESVLSGVGITDAGRLRFKGLDSKPHFHDVILRETGTLDDERLADEVLQGALELVDENPGVRGILLECSDLPPYAAAIQRATGLPVFDWAGFIRFVHDAVAPRTYTGRY